MAKTLTRVVAPADRLASALAGFGEARLLTLLSARPDLADPPLTDYARLAGRASSWPSVYACYRGLDAWCQQVVQALCLLPSGVTADQLAGFLGLDDGHADVRRAVEALADRALLIVDGAHLAVVPAFVELPYPAGLGPAARLVLGSQTNGQLAALAKRIGVSASTSKAATLDAISSVLASADRVSELVRRGPRGTAELVHQVADEGPVVVLAGLYGTALADSAPVGWLVNRGLLAVETWNTAVMPGEVGLALRGGRPFAALSNRCPPLHPAALGAETVDAAAAEAALRLVADIATILDDWSTAPAKLLKAGGVGIRDVRRAAKATGRTEAEVSRIVDLAAFAGLAVADLLSGTAMPTARYDDWLDLDAPARWQALVAGWLASPLHLGLAGEMSTKDKPIPPMLHRAPEPDAARRRTAVLSALLSVDPGGAVGAADLLDHARWAAPLLWGGGPGSLRMMVEWVVEEAELLGLAARRALSTSGRLAAAGRLDEARSVLAGHAPPVSTAFVVQADLTVVAPGELAPPVRAELELLADVESTGAATVYRLSEASLRRGFDAGRTPEGILAFLDEHASRDVPQSLRYLVGDLGRRFGQVRVGAARCYLRSDDASLLAEVVRSRATARLGLRLLAPTVAVASAEPDAVLRALRDAGHLPAQEDAGGGLVLVRPERHRAAPRAAARQSPRAGEGPDLAAVAAALAQAPKPRHPASAPPAPARPSPPPLPLPNLLFDCDCRPTEIFKGEDQVADLLVDAFATDWPVRLAYTNRKGLSTQLNVVVLSPPTDEVLVEVLPEGGGRTLVLNRIEWARVMTEAEEDHLYE